MGKSRMLDEGAYRYLKAATRRQIKAAGGLARAAAHTRVGKTELGYYQSPQSASRFIPIDIAADLVAATGQTIIVEALAALSGCTVVPENLPGDGLTEDMVRFAEYAAQAFRDYATIRSEREPRQERRIEQLDYDLEQVIRVAMHARQHLRAARAAQGAAARRIVNS